MSTSQKNNIICYVNKNLKSYNMTVFKDGNVAYANVSNENIEAWLDKAEVNGYTIIITTPKANIGKYKYKRD